MICGTEVSVLPTVCTIDRLAMYLSREESSGGWKGRGKCEGSGGSAGEVEECEVQDMIDLKGGC